MVPLCAPEKARGPEWQNHVMELRDHVKDHATVKHGPKILPIGASSTFQSC